jgi:hypothetical protein
MRATTKGLHGFFHHRFRSEIIRLADRETNHVGGRRRKVRRKATTNV